MKVLPVILALAASQACALAAQEPGDSLRVRLRTGPGWQEGRFVRTDSASLYLRTQAQDQAIPLASVEQAQVWRRQNAAVTALATGIGAAAGVGLFYLVSPNSEPLVGSKAGSIATAGLAGAAGGAIAVLIRPSVWVRVRPAGIAPAGPASPAARRSRRVLWGTVLAVAYAATIAGDYLNGGLDFPELFVPVAGPIIALARYNDVVSNPYYSGRNTDRVMFAASALVQSASLVMLIRSLGGGGGREARSLERVPVVSLAATGRGGFVVSCRTRF
jgi:hypothetical protein